MTISTHTRRLGPLLALAHATAALLLEARTSPRVCCCFFFRRTPLLRSTQKNHFWAINSHHNRAPRCARRRFAPTRATHVARLCGARANPLRFSSSSSGGCFLLFVARALFCTGRGSYLRRGRRAWPAPLHTHTHTIESCEKNLVGRAFASRRARTIEDVWLLSCGARARRALPFFDPLIPSQQPAL